MSSRDTLISIPQVPARFDRLVTFLYLKPFFMKGPPNACISHISWYEAVFWTGLGPKMFHAENKFCSFWLFNRWPTIIQDLCRNRSWTIFAQCPVQSMISEPLLSYLKEKIEQLLLKLFDIVLNYFKSSPSFLKSVSINKNWDYEDNLRYGSVFMT